MNNFFEVNYTKLRWKKFSNRLYINMKNYEMLIGVKWSWRNQDTLLITLMQEKIDVGELKPFDNLIFR